METFCVVLTNTKLKIYWGIELVLTFKEGYDYKWP